MIKILLLFVVTGAVTAVPYGIPYPQGINAPSYEYPPPPPPPPPAPKETPQPFEYSFEIKDEAGNTITRQESGDGSGAVTGSFSYIDENGIFRRVNYVADVDGFQPQIETNEPGTANANPASVQMTVQEPPVIPEAKPSPPKYPPPPPRPPKHVQQYRYIKVPIYGYPQ
ncbi:cuticle protein 10.9-like [Limulus polyphemus]|uniref:Cuticle protein 10.9-like n=1 Tax=Limulus polyphemus TaxID=6850 RepID=A0ABM1SJL6_LIMPO|nr:cuticle protein 10.9-like [Limulus polyphemus]